MPRSDRIYVFIVVGMASLLVIISIVATIAALTGSPKERPGYEKAPARALVKPNPVSGSIVNTDNLNRPPIDDQSYEALHKQTRILTREIASGSGYAERARSLGMPEKELRAVISRRKAVASSFAGLKPSRKVSITVYRPVDPQDSSGAELTNRTVASVALRSKDGDNGSLRVEYFWSFKDNVWFLQEAQVDPTVDKAKPIPANPQESGDFSDLASE